MKGRHLTLALIVLAATAGLVAQQPRSVHEKLYISLEATDDIAVVDTATNKVIKNLTVGSHPHGQAAPQSQDRLYVATEVGGTVALVDTIKDTVIKVFDVGFGTEPQNGAITPDGRFLYQPSYAGYYQVFDTQKEEIIEYIHTLGIGHNTVMDPNGRFRVPPADRRRSGSLEAPVARTAPDAAEGSDRRGCKDTQGGRDDSRRIGSTSWHDQSGRAAFVHERRQPARLSRHRYSRAQGGGEGRVRPDSGREGRAEPIARSSRGE